MNIVKVVSGFVPFFVFSVLVTALGVGWAAVAGLVAAVVVIAFTSRGGIKVLPVVQAVILAVMAVLGAVGTAPARHALVAWGPAAASLIMGAFMIGTAWVFPFTVQEARTGVPREIWRTQAFLAINRRISIAWGLAVSVLGVCQLVSVSLGSAGVPLPLRLLLNWVLPVAAFWQAAAYTKRTVSAASQRLRGRQESVVGNAA